MKFIVNEEEKSFELIENGKSEVIPLYSNRAFEIMNKSWLKVGWNQKYTYTFSWMGRPMIQLPEDVIRLQEVIYQLKPDLIIETGVAHGGSLMFHASICKAGGWDCKIIGVDIEIRPHNRKAIESHELFPYIELIEGSSIAPEIVKQVHERAKNAKQVLVILDSCHSREHVCAELEAYADLVTTGSYIVATDGVMKDVADLSLGKPEWKLDNPYEAAQDFLKKHPEFKEEQPAWPFNESNGLKDNFTHWPGAWLKKVQ